MFGFTSWGTRTWHGFQGRLAVPLPFGWTNVEPDKSPFVYMAIIASLGALAYSGWRERKAWPMILAAALIAAQFFMTWRLSEDRAHLWMIFGGVGGEFYLAAAAVSLFYFGVSGEFQVGILPLCFSLHRCGKFLRKLFILEEGRRGGWRASPTGR